MENFFSIIVDTCNQEKWIEKCLESCVSQDYENFEIIIVDAKSDDRTFQICQKFEKLHPKIKLYQNEIRQPQVANFIWLSKLAKDHSILVSIDGDDWFKHSMVLRKLNDVYESDEVWMTYGTYEEFPYRDVSQYYYPYPKHVVDTNTFREYRWLGSHLRTFRKDLILKIDEKDLFDIDGKWFSTTGDQAIMLPMLEMSSERSRYVPEVLYVYNVYDTSRDTSLNEKRQIELANYIRTKEKYRRLDKLWP